MEGDETQGVNRLVAHPILPLVVAANEDRHIRFYDHRSATLAHAMVAHLDAVTSLAVDPNGLYLLSGSKLNPVNICCNAAPSFYNNLTYTFVHFQVMIAV